MRRVTFKKFIPARYMGDQTTLIQGTNQWEKEFTHEGLFHQWGYAHEEFAEGPGNYTVALVELDDGTMLEVLSMALQFTDKPAL